MNNLMSLGLDYVPASVYLEQMNDSQYEDIIDLEIPEKLMPLLEPNRYKGIYGGRGSAKSRTLARVGVMRAQERSTRFLCVREIQNSIRDSVKRVIEDEIKRQNAEHMFRITDTRIFSKVNDTEFIFEGLRYNYDKIRSYEGIDVLWGEEAHSISQDSIDVVEPTIRADDSEIWYSWNPRLETDPIHQMFFGPNGAPPDSFVCEMNWRDNPWFPKVLRKQMEFMKRVDYDKYLHIYEGGTLKRSKAEIFGGKWRVDSFTPSHDWHGPYQGLDFGFSNDPTAFVRCWIFNNRLFIECEAVKTHLDIDKTVEYIEGKCPQEIKKHVTRADSARPESISYLSRHGLPLIEAAEKWPGSVEDGIAVIRAFDEIIIHPSCDNMIHEATWYRYKLDALTGEPTTKIVDAHNHGWDGVRYALAPIIRSKIHDYSEII